MIALRTHNLGFEVRGRKLLENVSFTLEAGEFLVLAGPNGAGKSTLLKLLAGDLRPSTGGIELLGKPAWAWPLRDLALRRAVLPQQATLSFAFTVSEVVRLGRTPHQSPTGVDAAAVARALERAGVAHLAHQSYLTLSGGERQRVHFARVLAQLDDAAAPSNAPKLLLLDEPTTGLDIPHQHSLLAQAADFAAAGHAVLAVLHDLHLTAQYATRVALLAHGRWAFDGPAAESLRPDRLNQLYSVQLPASAWGLATRPA
jgi:iron complex transport system ATP-binding protein